MKCRLVNENFQSNYTENLLKARGVENIEEFLFPTKDSLSSPTDLDNIDAGADLYLDVVNKNGKILLIVDSDNDGFTSAAIFYLYTKRLNPEIEIDYLLHKGKQHGLSDHMDTILNSKEKYSLVVLPDSSSNDFSYHEQLKEINLPCLILDHHINDNEVSSNAIIINNQMSEKYVNKELTGAGVVYQFCRYIDFLRDIDWADDYIDLAAWGIIGDMGSVIEPENRYIIYTGCNNVKNSFLLHLLDKQSYSITGKMAATKAEIIEALNPISSAFYLVPLVNATIRVGTDEEKERLFEAYLDGDKLIPSNKRGAKGTLEKAGIEVARECTNARSRQNRILDAAVDSIEAKIHKRGLLDNRILFVRLDEDDDFPPELNGLVAMKLSQKFSRPTIIARHGEDGYDKGSMRGLNQSELNSFKDFLENSSLFDYVSGHDNAAGISIFDKNLSNFHDYANKALNNIDFGENIYNVNFERDCTASDISDLITDISNHKKDKIWGRSNDEPLIFITNLKINKNNIQIMGKNKDTIKFVVNDISYIKFKAKELVEFFENIKDTVTIDVVGTANLNEWGGKITPQLFITDLDIKQEKQNKPEWALF